MIIRPARLIGVGSVVGRLTLTVPGLPSKGGDMVASGMRLQAGGAFVPVAAANRLGLPAVLCGRIGNGPFAQLIRAAMVRDGVTNLLEFVVGEQGFSVCAVEPDGDRTFITMPGVEATLALADLAAVTVEPDDAILIQGFDLIEPTAARDYAHWVTDPDSVGDAMVLFDPGSLLADIPDEILDRVLRRADVLLLDPREMALLTGQPLDVPSPEAAATLFGSLSPGAIIVVREAGSGAWLVTRDAEAVRFAGSDVEHRDGSVCRDVFTAALVAELGRLGEIRLAVRNATVAASITVLPTGHNRSVLGPDRQELDEALAAR